MPIKIDCPHCRASYNLKDELSGRQVRCKECREILRVPGEKVSQSTAAPPPAPPAPSSKPVAKKPAKAAPAKMEDDFDFGFSSEEMEDDVKECIHCGEEIEVDAKKCSYCGESQSRKAIQTKRKTAVAKKKRKTITYADRGSCPSGIRALGIFQYFIVFITLIAALAISQKPDASVGAVVLVFFTIFLGISAYSLMQGFQWVWWLMTFTYGYSIFSSVLSLIAAAVKQNANMEEVGKQAVGKIVGMVIATLLLRYFYSEEVRAYFRTDDFSMGKAALIYGVLFSLSLLAAFAIISQLAPA